MEEWQLELARALYILLTWNEPPPDFEERIDPYGYYVKHFTRKGKIDTIRRAMGGRRRFSAEDIFNIFEWHNQGSSFQEIAERFNPPVSKEATRLAYHKAKKALAIKNRRMRK